MKNYYWLNEDSRKFLGKDYLLPGVTPEERIRQIAETAERILGIEGFADKFEGYMSRGLYELVQRTGASKYLQEYKVNGQLQMNNKPQSGGTGGTGSSGAGSSSSAGGGGSR